MLISFVSFQIHVLAKFIKNDEKPNEKMTFVDGRSDKGR